MLRLLNTCLENDIPVSTTSTNNCCLVAYEVFRMLQHVCDVFFKNCSTHDFMQFNISKKHKQELKEFL